MHNANLLGQLTAPTTVGSGDLLGINVNLQTNIKKQQNKMNRQIIINAITGGIFGNMLVMLTEWGHPLYGIMLFAAFFVTLVNSLVRPHDA